MSSRSAGSGSRALVLARTKTLSPKTKLGSPKTKLRSPKAGSGSPPKTRSGVKRRIVLLMATLIISLMLAEQARGLSQKQALEWQRSLVHSFKAVKTGVQAISPPGYERQIGMIAGTILVTVQAHVASGKHLLKQWNQANLTRAAITLHSMHVGGASFNSYANAIMHKPGVASRVLSLVRVNHTAENLRMAIFGMLAWLIAAINQLSLDNVQSLVVNEMKHRGFKHSLTAVKYTFLALPVGRQLLIT